MLLCAPYFSSVVLAADAIMNAGTTPEQRASCSPGSRRVRRSPRLAFTEPNGRWDASGIEMEANGLGRRRHARAARRCS